MSQRIFGRAVLMVFIDPLLAMLGVLKSLDINNHHRFPPYIALIVFGGLFRFWLFQRLIALLQYSGRVQW